MSHLPFLISAVVDSTVDASAAHITAQLNRFVASLQAEMPHTPIVFAFEFANFSERQCATVLTDRQVRVSTMARPDTASSGDVSAHEGFLSCYPDVSPVEAQGIARLCSHCSLLLAISDGSNGGRARMALDFRMHSIPPELGGNRGVFFAPETGPVFLLEDGPPASVERGLASLLAFPHGQSFKQLSLQMHELDRANAAAGKLGLMRDVRSVADMPADPAEAHLVDAFRVADTLSRQQQKQVTWSHGGLLFLGLVAVVVMQCMGMFIPGLPMSDVYAVVFMLLGLGHLWIRKREAADQYADYRVLAECLRVQYFWRKSGVVAAPADCFLHKHMQRLSWVREAVKAFHLQFPSAVAVLDASLEPWVRAQQRYHAGSAKRNGRLDKVLRNAVVALYSASGVLTILVVLLPAHFVGNVFLGAALGVAASCGTLLLIFNGNMGFGSRAAQHLRMEASFALAGSLFTEVKHAHERRELLVDLGRETIQETSEWIYLQGPP